MAGTTGYDFLNQAEHVFVAPAGFAQLEHDYTHLIRRRLNFSLAAETGKREALEGGLSPGVRLLAARLLRLAAGVPPPVTATGARQALVEVITALPVYRTYIDRHTPPAGSPDDRRTPRQRPSPPRGPGAGALMAAPRIFLQHALLGESRGDTEQEQLRPLRFVEAVSAA